MGGFLVRRPFNFDSVRFIGNFGCDSRYISEARSLLWPELAATDGDKFIRPKTLAILGSLTLVVVATCLNGSLLLILGSPAPVQSSDFRQKANYEEEYSASLVVAPSAKSPKYLKYQDERQQVVYATKSEYPAEDVLSFISTELRERGWKPLPHDFLNPDIPSSHQRGWTFFEDHTQKPSTGVYAWIADWENGSHDIVVYALRYESPDNSTRNLRNLQVLALFIPAEIAAKMKRDAVNLKGEQQRNPPQWQNIDQLCGVLEFATPKKKTITTADGKTETRMYANVLKDAKVALYKGTASDEVCCGGKTPAGNTKSDELGRFELSGFQSGWYWLRIQSDNFSTTLPLHVTSDFNDKSCHDRSVGRIFTVDAQSPKVETRIY